MQLEHNNLNSITRVWNRACRNAGISNNTSPAMLNYIPNQPETSLAVVTNPSSIEQWLVIWYQKSSFQIVYVIQRNTYNHVWSLYKASKILHKYLFSSSDPELQQSTEDCFSAGKLPRHFWFQLKLPLDTSHTWIPNEQLLEDNSTSETFISQVTCKIRTVEKY